MRRRLADVAVALEDMCGRLGRAVQVDPIKLNLKPPGSELLRLKCDDALSIVAFNFNPRRYTWGSGWWRRGRVSPVLLLMMAGAPGAG